MARFHEVIDVPVPVEAAFAYVADFTTSAEWDPGIASARRTSGDGGVGTIYVVEALFRGKTVPFAYVVTALDPERSITLHGDGARATSDDVITFEPGHAEGTTRITYTADLRFKGTLRLVEPFLGATLAKLGAAALGGLRERLSRGV